MADTKKTVTIQLEDPIEFDKRTFTELTFRRMKAKDMAAMDLVKGETKKSLALYASMADVPLPVLEELSVDDWEAMVEATLPLMGKSARKRVEALREAANEPTTETVST